MSNINSSEILKMLSDATAEVIEKIAPSVVSINCGMGRGSGIVWTRDGYIATCSHVVGRNDKVSVGLREDDVSEAKVIARDPYTDVALLKVKENGLKPIELGDPKKLKVGQLVLALANPFNQQPSATSGIITNVGASLRRWGGMRLDDLIVTDTKLNPGYSGGPLSDASGKIIGMNTAYVWSRGVAINVDIVKSVIDRLKSGGRIKRAYLGITQNIIPLPEEVATQTKTNQDKGILVLSVEKDSPAKKAGLALGDIIVGFNEKPVAGIYDLPRLLSEEVIGKKVKIKILRGEKLLELVISPSILEADVDE
jgi:S1-C subfamily serine protease